ncbi:MAG: hypothetical protein AABW81_04240 [Nanoarchaeota archaeon]
MNREIKHWSSEERERDELRKGYSNGCLSSFERSYLTDKLEKADPEGKIAHEIAKKYQ